MLNGPPSTATSTTLGATLRGLRTRAGLSREQLAKRAGLSQQTISALEQGARRHPYPHTLAVLADALELVPADRAALQAAATFEPRRVKIDPPSPIDPPPVRAHILSRQRLLDGLDEALSHPITLVVAPAGFGKTSLLVDWQAHLNRRAVVSWVSVDSTYNDPARFWRALLAALQVRSPTSEERAPNGVVTPDAILDQLTQLVAVLDRPLVLVLDDYHVIRTAAIHSGLTYLLNHRPPRLHLVLSTRSDPPLALARLRANGELAELRAADLRFSTREAAMLLDAVTGLALSSEQVAALDARTEGWAAGLQLAALSLRQRADVDDAIARFTGSDRFVIDYFVEEVLTQLPDRTRRFLERTSVLGRMNGPLCDELLGECGGSAMLDELERANLFVTPIDHHRDWFRYHQLFSVVLRHRLRRDETGLEPTLHERASLWYAANGHLEEAVEHALEGRCWDRAADLMAPLMRVLLQRGEERTADRWLTALPARLCHEHPVLSPYRASTLLQLGEFPAAAAFVEAAEPLLEAEGQSAALGKVLSVHATMAAVRYESATAIACAERALSLLPPDQPGYRGTALNAITRAYLQLGKLTSAEHVLSQTLELTGRTLLPLISWDARDFLGVLSMLQGNLVDAAAHFEQLLEMVGERPVFFRQRALIRLAGLAYERNRLDDASAYLDRYLEARQRAGRTLELPFPWLLRARIARAQGQPEAAESALDRTVTAARSVASTRLEHQARALRAWIALDRGDCSAAGRWADDVSRDTHGLESFAREPELLILARVRLAQGAPAMVQTSLERVLVQADKEGRGSSAIALLTLIALTRSRRSDEQGALIALERAVRLAEPDQHSRVFLDEGQALAPLLRRLLSSGVAAAYVAGLLRALEPVRGKPLPSGEIVTRREREVLGLVALGLSNRSIAEQLVTSEATIKSHVHRLIGKLGVGNRGQVVVRAQQIGALPMVGGPRRPSLLRTG